MAAPSQSDARCLPHLSRRQAVAVHHVKEPHIAQRLRAEAASRLAATQQQAHHTLASTLKRDQPHRPACPKLGCNPPLPPSCVHRSRLSLSSTTTSPPSPARAAVIQHQQLYAQQNAAGAPERCHAGRWIRLGRPAVARRVRQPHLVTRPEPSFAAAAAATAPCVGAVRVVQRQAACSKAPEPRTLRRGKASLPLRPTSIACPAH